jgi:hypothetical protein
MIAAKMAQQRFISNIQYVSELGLPIFGKKLQIKHNSILEMNHEKYFIGMNDQMN